MHKPWESGCFEVLCNSMEEEAIFEDDKSPYEIVNGEIRWREDPFIKDENGELKLCPELSEMESFEVPSAATRISDRFFANFKNLKSVTIPREVTSIGEGAFEGCERLKSVEIPAGLNSALNAYPSVESIKYNDHGEISKITRTCRNNGWYEYMIYPSDELLYSWSEIIPSADYMAETDLSPVTSVHMQTKENRWESRLDAFKSGGECFSRTKELTQKEEKCLYIGGSSKALNKKVFINWYNNHSYIAIMMQQITGYEKIYEYAERIFKIRPEMHSYVTDFVIKDGVIEKYIGNGENISIPYNVDHIGKYAFFCCDTLLSVAIPKGVITIGTGALFGCENLKSVAVPNTVTSIGALAFFGCKNLSGVTVPGSVAAINSWAFSGCGSLTEVKIPESVAYIGDEAFRGCGKLSSLSILNRGVTIGSHAFDACKALKNAVIPPCAKEIFLKYKSVKSITCLEDDPQGMPSDCTRQKMISAISYYRAENRQIGVYGIKLLEGSFKDEPEVKFISYCLALKGMRQFVGTPDLDQDQDQDQDQEGVALYKIQILANSGYSRARTFLDIYCGRRYQKYIKSLPANDSDCGPLVDFDGKPIKIDRSGTSLPMGDKVAAPASDFDPVDEYVNGFRSGTWTFDKWDNGAVDSITAPVTFKGTWLFEEAPKHTYTLTYVGNGGVKGTETTLTDSENVTDTYATVYEMTADSCEFTLDRYAFQGWAETKEDADAGKVTVKAGDAVEFSSEEKVTDKTLYAVWKQVEFSVTVSNSSTGYKFKDGDTISYSVAVNGTKLKDTYTATYSAANGWTGFTAGEFAEGDVVTITELSPHKNNYVLSVSDANGGHVAAKKGDYAQTLTITDSDTTMAFANAYTPYAEEYTPAPVVPVNPTIPTTGDSTTITVAVAMILMSAVVAFVAMRKREN